MTKLIVRLVLLTVLASTAIVAVAPSAYAGVTDTTKGATRMGFKNP